MTHDDEPAAPHIAVIGMAGRFPESPDLQAFWANLAAGVECIRHFSAEELEAEGIPAALREHPFYVPARGVIGDPALFDAEFFGFSATEARLTDPQHRVFLEEAWHALEDGGYDPDRYDGAIGVFAGSDVNSYALGHLLMWTHDIQSLIGNDKDYLATRTAFRLDLRGPAITVQTACSTSLVAVQIACQSLLAYQCDMALAGGVGLAFPQKAGYVYQAGGILSPDGHCRAFDASSKGTVGGDGCGVVLLKRLEDALADGDPIRAVIRAAALNNDGRDKIGFTAPSVKGQAEVIALTQAMADVEPDSITYVEAHGTGTQLGDPIEIAALQEVFAAGTERRGFCALGSVKSNVGHMNSAAGIGGFIKTVLALEHARIPPSLHFASPNPECSFDTSCFYVNTELRPWISEGPRRAAVSAFGVGGTNAHAILEQAPLLAPSDPAPAEQLVVVSAHTEGSLASLLPAIQGAIQGALTDGVHPLADVAFTLQAGRRAQRFAKLVVARSGPEAAELLGAAPVLTLPAQRHGSVAFLFPGQGAQHAGMGAQLYAEEPVYAEAFDACAAILQPALGDVHALLEDTGRLGETAITQPLLFAVEYSLAQLWRARGVEPVAMVGHSVGEYVAACIAGTLTLEDALSLLVARGRLIQALPPGAMLAVLAAEAACPPLAGMELAAVNAPEVTVYSGTIDAADAAERTLTAAGIGFSRLAVSHAFHSPLLEPMLGAFRDAVERVELRPPTLPWLSNVTGTWITTEDAVDPAYWVEHVRRAVRFDDAVTELLGDPDTVLLEVGPGTSLGGLVKRRGPDAAGRIVSSLGHARSDASERASLLQATGLLHLHGVRIDWTAVHGNTRRRRVSLPGTVFDGKRHWQTFDLGQHAVASQRLPVDRWLSQPVWHPALPAGPGPSHPLTLALADADHPVLAGLPGRTVRIRPEAEHLQSVVDALVEQGSTPTRILHLWSHGPAQGGSFEREQTRGAIALTHAVRAVTLACPDTPLEVVVVGSGLLDPVGVGSLVPNRAPLLGVVQVLGQELRQVTGRVIDAEAPVQRIHAELALAGPPRIALRGRQRLQPAFVPVPPDASGPPVLREGGVVVVTGGLGGIGLTLAERLAEHRTQLVLTGRTGLPSRASWPAWLGSHPERDPVSTKIRRIQAMEASGASVLVAAVDCGDLAGMRTLFERVQAELGPIDGVVHAAGLAGGSAFRAVADTGPGQFELHFHARVAGVDVLAQLVPASARFVALVSSLSTTLGGAGLLAYAAANHYLDATAATRDDPEGTRWCALGWDAWDHGGLGAGIRPSEGQAVFERALGLGCPRLIVSTVELASRQAAAEATVHAVAPTSGEVHARPELDTPFVAPSDPLEQQVAQLFLELFSLDRVGMDDNFFQLGGDSLLAIQLSTRLRDELGVDLPVNALFEQPTLRAVVERIRTLTSSIATTDPTRALVAGLSDDEVRRMLAELEPSADAGALIDESRFDFETDVPLERDEVQRFYDSVSKQLNAGPFRDFALFLNYGYVPNETPLASPIDLPPNRMNRNTTQLVLELVGDLPLGPKDRVLDIGCGRGGTIAVLREFFDVGHATGLDLAPSAVAFCKRRHDDGHTHFVHGDAMDTGLETAGYDAVFNVESSHSYPDVDAFLQEVARVCRPGGAFLYTDVIAAEDVEAREARLAALGFQLERKVDITPNVLLSCDETAVRNAKAFTSSNSAAMMGRFLGVPDSDLYNAMKLGKQRYMLYRFARLEALDGVR